MVETIGFWAGVALPLFDIPLIVQICRRKSSADISVVWAIGIWASSVLMAPSAYISGDMAAIGFNTVNVIMLTAVVVAVLKFRKGQV